MQLKALRRLGLKATELARPQSATIRLKVRKIGALIRITVRKVGAPLAGGSLRGTVCPRSSRASGAPAAVLSDAARMHPDGQAKILAAGRVTTSMRESSPITPKPP